MPWTGPQFASRHNHSLGPGQAAHAARIANAVLKRGVPEGESIAIANKHFQHRDTGGGVDPTQGGIGGVTPSAQTMSPISQGLIQQYSALPVEKLQELAARMGGSPQGAIIRQILQRKLRQPQAQQQAPAQAPQQPGGAPATINPAAAGTAGLQMMGAQPPMARGGYVRRAMGGGFAPMDPWTQQTIEQQPTVANQMSNIQEMQGRVRPPQMQGAPGMVFPTPAASPIPGQRHGGSVRRAGGGAAPVEIRVGHGAPVPNTPLSPDAGFGTQSIDLGPAGRTALTVAGFLPGIGPLATLANLGITANNYLAKNSSSGPGPGGSAQGFGPAGQGAAVGTQNDSNGPPGMGGVARGGGIHRAMGGDMGVSPSQASPWWTRSEARGSEQSPGGGFLAGTTGGRADAITTTAPGGSHVLPADVVAGLGDGNSLAGARVMDEILRSGPHGTPMERSARGMGPPRAPSVPRDAGFARAGGVHGGSVKPTPVKLSHGEIVISPEHVRMIGGGDEEKGHEAIDRFILAVRKRYAEKLRRLPPPVGSKAA